MVDVDQEKSSVWSMSTSRKRLWSTSTSRKHQWSTVDAVDVRLTFSSRPNFIHFYIPKTEVFFRGTPAPQEAPSATWSLVIFFHVIKNNKCCFQFYQRKGNVVSKKIILLVETKSPFQVHLLYHLRYLTQIFQI